MDKTFANILLVNQGLLVCKPIEQSEKNTSLVLYSPEKSQTDFLVDGLSGV